MKFWGALIKRGKWRGIGYVIKTGLSFCLAGYYRFNIKNIAEEILLCEGLVIVGMVFLCFIAPGVLLAKGALPVKVLFFYVVFLLSPACNKTRKDAGEARAVRKEKQAA